MKISGAIIFALLLLAAPVLAFAECSTTGTTVVFINGIFGTEEKAESDKADLKDKFLTSTGKKDVTFVNGFNPSHVRGLDDVIGAGVQMYVGGKYDYDLTNILRQLHADLKTQKIVLVGHSQGSFYANATYEWLVSKGVNKNSIAVYNIGTPASYVAGNGDYLTSKNDKVVAGLATKVAEIGSAHFPLPPNVELPALESQKNDKFGGHYFSENYLGEAGDTIISTLDGIIGQLQAGDVVKEECFAEPKTGVAFWLQDKGYMLADTILNNPELLAQDPTKSYAGLARIGKGALNFGYDIARAVFSSIQSIFAKGRGGASVSTALEQNEPETIPELEPEPAEPEPEMPTQLSPQDQLDDIQERIDLLARQVAELIVQSGQGNVEGVDSALATASDIQEVLVVLADAVLADAGLLENIYYSTGGGTGNHVIYPKILISEVQTALVTDTKQEFVELYNPNDEEIDLTDWYLQRKTSGSQSWSTFASNNLFSGKKIPAKGYFLIAREGYYLGTADIFTSNPITDDNSFALKDPNGDIVDQASLTEIQAGSSYGRKWDPVDNMEKDFELQNPTPKTQNITYVEPEIIPLTDTTAPEVKFSLDAMQSAISFDINFTIEDPLDVVSPSGLKGYVFRWQEASEGETWHEDTNAIITESPALQDFVRNFTGEDEKTYNFQVKAEDVAGNESDWQPETPAETKIGTPKKILINEIQLTGANADDEFIELYNPNDVEVDLAGFALKKKTASGVESPLVASGSFVGVIPSHGVFLIVPKDNDEVTKKYTGLHTPDLRYSAKDYYISKDSTILLYGNYDNLLDKVGFGSAGDFETKAVANPLTTANPYTPKSIERKKAWEDTDNNFNDFKVSNISTPGEVLIKNETNFSLTNWGSTNGINFYGIYLSWQSQYQNVASFDVQYKFSGSAWRDWINGTTDTSGIFSAFYSLISPENVYSFQVRSRDTSGNLSDWTQIDVDLSAPVVINEIALYGTNAGTTDKWIELYNKTANPVNVTGWYLKSASGTSPFMTYSTIYLSCATPEQCIIQPFEYFILESPNNSVISDTTANQTSTKTILTKNLELFDKKGRTIDKLYMPQDGTGWKESDFKVGTNYYSVERISPYAEGKYAKNWKINNGITKNGKDRNGGNILGTPGAQNSNYLQYTLLAGGFGRDTELPKSLSPYLVEYELKIKEGVTLTIDPGAVLKFYDGYADILASGTLKAVGSPDDKIIFTSFRDTPAPGDWLGIQILPNSKNSEISNAEIRYAGSTAPVNWGVAVWVRGTSILLKDTLFEKNKHATIKLESFDALTSSIVDNIRVIGEGDDASRGVVISEGSPEVKNSYFENNETHIEVQGSATPNLHDNTFVDPPPPAPEMRSMMLLPKSLEKGSGDALLPLE